VPTAVPPNAANQSGEIGRNDNGQMWFIKNRLGLLELANQLGNVSQACNILGYSRDTFCRYTAMYEPGHRSPDVITASSGPGR